MLKRLSLRSPRLTDLSRPKPGSSRECWHFGMYRRQWSLIKPIEPKEIEDPVEKLDVTAFTIDPIALTVIGDQRTDNRSTLLVDRAALRNSGALIQEKCRSASHFIRQAADLMDVADADMIMPPKSTWFELLADSMVCCHSTRACEASLLQPCLGCPLHRIRPRSRSLRSRR